MGTREGIPGVRFLLVHTEEWHCLVNKRVLCTIGVVVISRSTAGLLLFFLQRGVFSFGQHKMALFMSETARTVCIGRHAGHVGPGTVCACVLFFLHFGCSCFMFTMCVILVAFMRVFLDLQTFHDVMRCLVHVVLPISNVLLWFGCKLFICAVFFVDECLMSSDV